MAIYLWRGFLAMMHYPLLLSKVSMSSRTEHHEISGLADFSARIIDDESIIYASPQQNGYSLGSINLKTGENYVFKEQYPTPSFNTFLSPDKKMMSLIFSEGVGKHDVKVKLLSMDDRQFGSFETATGDNGWGVWSPDNSMLAVFTNSNNGPTTMHLLGADGTELRQIDNLPNRFYVDKWTDCG